MKLLMVEDNALLGKSLKRGLEEQGCSVDLVANGEDGLFMATTTTASYDVIILDWMLPQPSGLAILAKLRAARSRVPVIMITAKGAVTDRVDGLNTGADDYLVKPFAMEELLARVHAVYRRSLGLSTSNVVVARLNMDLAAHTASCAGKALDLTGKEYDLLAALAAKAGKLVSRDNLAWSLYDSDHEPGSNSLDVLLARVRKKVAGSGVEIATVRGKGFVLRPAACDQSSPV